MGSEEVDKDSKMVEDRTTLEMDLEKEENLETEKKTNGDNYQKKKKEKRQNWLLRRFSCMGLEEEIPTVGEPAGDGNFNLQAKDRAPTHLVVMVNGIIGSAEDWKYAAKQFIKAYPQDVMAHCSEANSSILTFDGVDVMGKRLADEVLSVIRQHPNLQKISFVGHSLGGLIARYAIARLYKQDFPIRSGGENGEYKFEGSKDSLAEDKLKGAIAELESVNFITSATPHLGSRGHKQVPAFCGLYAIEKVASHSAWILGRTGKHLMLTDQDDGKPPLLLQMVDDTEELQFISALQSFKRRVVYANVRYDQLVGWSTSSLRRRNELPKRRNLLKNDKYPHIVNIETAKAAISPEENYLEVKVKGSRTRNMEETMLRSLTKLSWERVDVYFCTSMQRFFAHNTIQVPKYRTNSDGADVIQHMIDKFML